MRDALCGLLVPERLQRLPEGCVEVLREDLGSQLAARQWEVWLCRVGTFTLLRVHDRLHSEDARLSGGLAARLARLLKKRVWLMVHRAGVEHRIIAFNASGKQTGAF